MLSLRTDIHIVWKIIGAVRPYWQFGWIGVDLFFVLSAYLIGNQVFKPWAQAQSLSLGRFYVRRALRIFQAYWPAIAMAIFNDRMGVLVTVISYLLLSIALAMIVFAASAGQHDTPWHVPGASTLALMPYGL